jgi:hypothetical protein
VSSFLDHATSAVQRINAIAITVAATVPACNPWINVVCGKLVYDTHLKTPRTHFCDQMHFCMH